MRITKITVTNLFGIFKHEIPLNLDERITIIHGPNGFGKTILLKMLDGLFNGKYSELHEVPFQRFKVNLENGSTVWVDKASASQQTMFDEEDLEQHKSYSEITINFFEANSTEPQSFSLDSIRAKHIPRKMLEDLLPLERVGPDAWLYHSKREILSFATETEAEKQRADAKTHQAAAEAEARRAAEAEVARLKALLEKKD